MNSDPCLLPNLKAELRRIKSPQQDFLAALEVIVSDERWLMIPQHIRHTAFLSMEDKGLQN